MLLCTVPLIFKLLNKLVEMFSLIQYTYSKFIINKKTLYGLKLTEVGARAQTRTFARTDTLLFL